PVLIDEATLAALNGAVDAVRTAGWPPVFAFVYDEFWSLVRIPAITTLLSATLGRGFRQIPHVWVHVVPPIEGGRGWTPHVDGYQNDRISVWLALSDATVENECMHLVPKADAPIVSD